MFERAGIERGGGAKSGNLTLIQTEINGADMKTPLTKEKILQMSLEELQAISPEEKPECSVKFYRKKMKFVALRSGLIAILQGAFIKTFSFKKIALSGARIFPVRTI